MSHITEAVNSFLQEADAAAEKLKEERLKKYQEKKSKSKSAQFVNFNLDLTTFVTIRV